MEDPVGVYPAVDRLSDEEFSKLKKFMSTYKPSQFEPSWDPGSMDFDLVMASLPEGDALVRDAIKKRDQKTPSNAPIRKDRARGGRTRKSRKSKRKTRKH